MMWRRLLVLDLALLGGFLYGGVLFRQSWKEFDASHRVDAVKAESENARIVPALTAGKAPAEDWTDISVKDPFSFDRNDVAIVAPKSAAATQPKPILFGTLSVGKEWIAMLSTAQEGNRASHSVKVGESIGDWQVVEIHNDSVVVAAENGSRQTITLSESTVQVPRDYSRTSSGAGSTAPVTIVSPSAPSPAQQPATDPGPAAAPAASPAVPSGGQAAPKTVNTPFGPVIDTTPVK